MFLVRIIVKPLYVILPFYYIDFIIRFQEKSTLFIDKAKQEYFSEFLGLVSSNSLNIIEWHWQDTQSIFTQKIISDWVPFCTFWNKLLSVKNSGNNKINNIEM